MQPINDTAAKALRTLLDQQPLTAAKIGFAWRLAAGPTLASAAVISWSSEDGRLVIRAKSDAWRQEILRARPVILDRLRGLVGPDVVRVMKVTT